MMSQARPARPGPVVMAMCLAVIVVMMNALSMNMVIPEMSRSVGADQSQVQWIIDSYLLVLAALLLPAGALLDRYGRRRGITIGLVVIAGAFLWTAWADSANALIAARCLAGAAAALILPGTLATLTAVLPEAKRGMAVGMWAGSMIFGGFVGIMEAALCLKVAWWGSVFVTSAVVSLLVLALSASVIPETSDPEHANLDPLGAALSAVGIGAVVLGITEGPSKGWTDPLTLGALVAGPLLLGAFAWWELRTPRPMLELALFRHRAFSGGTVTIFVAFVGAYGWIFMAVQYQAFVLDYDTMAIALGLLPNAAAMVPLAVLGPRLAANYGRRAPILLALVAMTAAAMVMTALGGRGYWALLPAFAVFLSGIALLGGPATEAIIDSLPAARQGVASAINDVARELGAAFGVAAVGSAFNAAYRSRVGELLVSGSLTDTVKSSPAAGLATAAQSGEAGPRVAETVKDGVVSGWTAAWVVMAAVCAAGTAFVALRFPARSVAAVRAAGPHAADAGSPAGASAG